MLVSFKTRAARKVRGTNVAAGQTCYAVKKGDLVFVWAYSDREFAEKMDAKLTGPENDRDRGANWRQSVHDTLVSGRKSF